MTQPMFPQQAMQNTQPSFPPMAEGDDRLFVQFYMGARENPDKTLAEGHPVFDSIPFIKIMVPGDKNTVIDTSVDDVHKRRFAKMWYAFEQSQSQELSGMPLREWPGITRSQAEELVHMNILTVEQLSTVADVYGTKIMGFNDLRRKAQTYLAHAKDTALTEKLSAENKKLQDQITAQADEIKRISAAFEAMRAGLPALKGQNDNGAGTRTNSSD